jgi:hypothetical protein
LLAKGDLVTPAVLAARSGVPEAVVRATLEDWPGVFNLLPVDEAFEIGLRAWSKLRGGATSTTSPGR